MYDDYVKKKKVTDQSSNSRRSAEFSRAETNKKENSNGAPLVTTTSKRPSSISLKRKSNSPDAEEIEENKEGENLAGKQLKRLKSVGLVLIKFIWAILGTFFQRLQLIVPLPIISQLL